MARYWMLFTPVGLVTWVTRKANARSQASERSGDSLHSDVVAGSGDK
jgi:hypothetical protein